MSECRKQGYHVSKLHHIVSMLHCQDIIVTSFMFWWECTVHIQKHYLMMLAEIA